MKRKDSKALAQELQLQLAERQGLKISDTQLEQAIQSIAADNKMNLEQLRAQLEREGLTYAQYREEVRREILRQLKMYRRQGVPGADNALTSLSSRPRQHEAGTHRVWRVLLPGILPGLVSGAIFAFISKDFRHFETKSGRITNI